MRARLPILIVVAGLAIAGCGGGDSSSTSVSSTQKTTATAPQRSKPKVVVPNEPPPKELVVKDLIKGDGATAESGDQVVVQYVGVDYKTGKQFDASWDRGQPFPFVLGAGSVIPGWDKGVVGMKVGGRRELIIPPNLAYGASGVPGAIPPNATLVFVIDLLSVK